MSDKMLNILLVDDNESHVELIRRAFMVDDVKADFTIADTLTKAQKLLRESTPELMIVDFLLPDGEGTALLPGSMEAQTLPVIILTGQGNEKVAAAAIKAGALDYVVKSTEIFTDMPHIVERALREWNHITERRKAEDDVRYRLHIEQLLAEVSRQFATAQTIDMDEILSLLGQGIEANRAYIFQFSDNEKKMSNSYEWCAPGTQAQIDNLQEMDVDIFPWWMKKMHAGENILIPDVSLLAADAAAEKDILQQQDIRSLLVVPMISLHGALFGFMGFDDTEKTRNWKDEDARSLRVAGEMMIAYLERRQSEAALQTSELHFRTMVEQSPFSIQVLSPDGWTLQVNRAWEELWGIGLEMLKEYNMLEDQQLIKTGLMPYIRKGFAGQPTEIPPIQYHAEENPLVSVPSSHRWVRGWIYPLKDSADNIREVIIMHEDVTEHKQAEDALRSLSTTFSAVSGEAFFSKVASHLATALGMDYAIIGELTGDGDRVNVVGGYAHGQAMALPFEYSLARTPCEKVMGQSFCIWPSGVQKQFPDDALLVEMDVEGYLGAPLFDSSGHALGIILLMHGKPIASSEAAKTLFRIFSSRVSAEIERRRAERALHRLSAAIEQAGESVLITDREGMIEYINPAFTKMTGYTAEEAIGKTPKLLKSGNQDAAFYANMWETITAGNIWRGKVIDRKKDGSFYPATLTISPIFDQSADPSHCSHYVGIQSDLTRIEDMEKQFHQAQKMEALGTLVGGIAHDFNNMLAGMTANLYLAKQRIREMPEVVQKLDNVADISFRAAAMIQQLLTFARKGAVSMKEMPFTPFIKETLKLLRTSLPENIAMHQDICSENLQIRGDATQFHQVLMNLVNNARDAVENGDKPNISIRLEVFHPDDAFMEAHAWFSDKAYAHLSVADNGIGIPEHQIKHLFEPFFTTKEVGKGTGLGLAMVFGAIKTHQGFVEVESKQGEGSSFHIYIPLLKSKEMASVSVQEEETAEGRGELILLADDEAHVLETAREVLESLGYKVLTASNGKQAVEIFEASCGSIDLCIFDVVMPVLDGDKAAQAIRRINPDAKIIFSTGYDKKLLSRIGDETVLSKPFSIEQMSRLIRQQFEPEESQA